MIRVYTICHTYSNIWVAKDPSFLLVDSKDWSDWADAQADLSLNWVHMPLCCFHGEMRKKSYFTIRQIFWSYEGFLSLTAYSTVSRPASMAQLDACLTVDQYGRVGNIYFFLGDYSWNIFCSHSLPSTDSRRAVSVSGERMCTILVNHLKTGFSNWGSGSQYREYFTYMGKGWNLF